MAQKHDPYCWKCCKKETVENCKKCVRSYHLGCWEGENTANVCSVCNKLSTLKDTPAELKMIPFIISTFQKSEFIDLYKKKNNVKSGKRKRVEKPFSEKVEKFHFNASKDIVNPIDLPKIEENANTYTSLYEFFVDVQWFVHNCEISFTENHDKTRRAKRLLALVSAEVESVKKCLDCHFNANGKDTRSRWFTMVCSTPHLIVWAKPKNGRYGPAKIMSIDGDQVNVRFFGGYHKHENVPVYKCYLYSEESPNHYNPKSNVTESALEEVNQYINNIRKKYGSFQLAAPKNRFNPALYNDYIRDLTSGTTTCPRNVAEQCGEENGRDSNNGSNNGRGSKIEMVFDNESDSGDTVEYPAEIPTTAFKSEPSVVIEDVNGLFDETRNGTLENNDENSDINSDLDDPMEYENGLNASDNESDVVDNELDAESIADYNISLNHFVEGFDRICKTNAALKEDLKKRELQVKTLEETNTKLVAEKEQFQNEHKEQIEVLKRAHDQELTRLKEQHQRMIEEQKQAIVEQYEATVKRCKQECSQRVEDAKKNKYCMGCGNGKPLDIYVCNPCCQGRCWERENKSMRKS